MKKAFLIFGLAAIGICLTVAITRLATSAGAAPSEGRPGRAQQQMEGSLAVLDPQLMKLAEQLQGNLARNPRGGAERSLSWTQRDGAIMLLQIRLEEIQDKPKLRLTLESLQNAGGEGVSPDTFMVALNSLLSKHSQVTTTLTNLLPPGSDTAAQAIANLK
jgi:hypothetical protein